MGPAGPPPKGDAWKCNRRDLPPRGQVAPASTHCLCRAAAAGWRPCQALAPCRFPGRDLAVGQGPGRGLEHQVQPLEEDDRGDKHPQQRKPTTMAATIVCVTSQASNTGAPNTISSSRTTGINAMPTSRLMPNWMSHISPASRRLRRAVREPLGQPSPTVSGRPQLVRAGAHRQTVEPAPEGRRVA